MSISSLNNFLHKPHAWIWETVVETPVRLCSSIFASKPQVPTTSSPIRSEIVPLQKEDASINPKLLGSIDRVAGNVDKLDQAELIFLLDQGEREPHLRYDDRYAYGNEPFFDCGEKIEQFLDAHGKKGDVVLLKGNSSMERHSVSNIANGIKVYSWDNQHLPEFCISHELNKQKLESHLQKLLDFVDHKFPNQKTDLDQLAPSHLQKHPKTLELARTIYDNTNAYNQTKLTSQNEHMKEAVCLSRLKGKVRYVSMRADHWNEELTQQLKDERIMLVFLKNSDKT